MVIPPVRLALLLMSGLASTFMALAPASAVAQVTEACVFDKHRSGVAKVAYRYVTESDGTATESGSGFLVSNEGHIVTNAHVIAPRIEGLKIKSSVVTVQLGSLLAPTAEAEVLLKSDTLDIAILKLKDIGAIGPVIPVPISPPSLLAVGSTLIALGFPGTDMSISKGAKSSLVAMSPNVDPAWIQTSLPLNAGNSGGPVFGPMGTVIGVAIAKTRNAQLITYVLPIELVSPFLQSLGIKSSTAGPCAACRHASHGVEKYNRDFLKTGISPWYGGGHDQARWCVEYGASLILDFPESLVQVANSSEAKKNTCPPANCPQYQYSCTIRVQSSPIYVERASAACAN